MDELLRGCSEEAIEACFPARSFAVNAATGNIVASLPEGRRLR
jgi:hypothetical protein